MALCRVWPIAGGAARAVTPREALGRGCVVSGGGVGMAAGRRMGGWEATGWLWREWGWWASCPESHGPSRWDPTQKEVELVPRKPRGAFAASASLHSSGRSVDGSLRAGRRCHREESDTAFLACACRVGVGGRKSYRYMEIVTFTAESARRCGQASGRGRKERICHMPGVPFLYPKL